MVCGYPLIRAELESKPATPFNGVTKSDDWLIRSLSEKACPASPLHIFSCGSKQAKRWPLIIMGRSERNKNLTYNLSLIQQNLNNYEQVIKSMYVCHGNLGPQNLCLLGFKQSEVLIQHWNFLSAKTYM